MEISKLKCKKLGVCRLFQIKFPPVPKTLSRKEPGMLLLPSFAKFLRPVHSP